MRSRRNTELLLLLAATPPVLLVFALVSAHEIGEFSAYSFPRPYCSRSCSRTSPYAASRPTPTPACCR